MSRRLPVVVLVGRPNVGKSTLFNRIAGSRRAIVAPMPGTTRDVIAQPAEWQGHAFLLTDTGGMFGASQDPLHELVVARGRTAIASADLVVCVVDAVDGRVAADDDVAAAIRAAGKPVVLAVNKTDDRRSRAGALEFYQLGFDAVVEVSAEHGLGIGDLLDLVVQRVGGRPEGDAPRGSAADEATGKPGRGLAAGVDETVLLAGTGSLEPGTGDRDLEAGPSGPACAPGLPSTRLRPRKPRTGEQGRGPVGTGAREVGRQSGGDGSSPRPRASALGDERQAADEGVGAEGGPGAERESREPAEVAVAIVGRPNVGKSSLVNRLLREDRVLVSDMPGTTRDAIDVVLRWHSRTFRIVDTAGIRRPGRVARAGAVESVSVLQARRAIAQADVVVLVVDAVEGATDQDSAIAGEADKAGRALVVAANKWDLMKGRGPDAAREFDDELRRKMKFLDHAPLLHISAVTGERVPRLLETVDRVAAARTRRVGTSELNRFVDAVTSAHPPVSPGRREVRVLYATQVGVAPPTFVFFTNVATTFHFSYERFLINQLREVFGFEGTPIRIQVRARSARRARS